MKEDHSDSKNNLLTRYKKLKYILFIVCWYWDESGILIKSGLDENLKNVKFKPEDCDLNIALADYIWFNCPYIFNEQGAFAFHINDERAFAIGDINYSPLNTTNSSNYEEAFFDYDIDLYDNYKAILYTQAKDYSSIENVASFKLHCFEHDENWLWALFTNPTLSPAFINLVLHDQDPEIHSYALEHIKLFPEKKELL